MKIPQMFRVRQRFPSRKLADVAGVLRVELTGCSIQPGKRIAIAVGSRGITNLPLLVRELAGWLRSQGAEPFIVPAMGSHAGATAEGQRRLLEHLGVDAAPIVSSMDVVELAPGAFMDRQAFEADGIIVINRIKPHTSFHGMYESGLMKMVAVGLGKHAGALAVHALGVRGLRKVMPEVARQVLATGKILYGVALVEDAYDETMLVQVLPSVQILAREPELLALARANMPFLPVKDIDVLVVDEIGKDISGTGMDTNVIGRLRIEGETEPAAPRIKKIVVRDLVGESAYGIGLADVTTQRLVEKADWQITKTNVQTSGFTKRGEVPVVADTDAGALALALPAGPRVIRIQNTLHLERMLVSKPVLKSIAGRDTIEMLGPATDWLEPLTI